MDAERQALVREDVARQMWKDGASWAFSAGEALGTDCYGDDHSAALTKALARLATSQEPQRTASRALGWMDSEGPVTVAPGKPSQEPSDK